MKSDCKSAAFSLLELVVVLVILALLTSLSGLALRAHIAHASLMRAQAVAGSADHYCRQLAQRSPAGTVELVIDAKRGQLLVRPADRKFELPKSSRLAAAMKHSSDRQEEATQRIQFHSPGVSANYSLRFEQGDSTLWIGFLGLSGQNVVFGSEQELRELFP